MNFINLHSHTEFSLLDGVGKVKDIVARAQELNQSAIAITDHGTCGGHYNFSKACKDKNVKPIFGCEVYIVADRFKKSLSDVDKQAILESTPDEKEQKLLIRQKEKEQKIRSSNHLILLAKNNDGLTNIYKIVSDAAVNGFYYRPRTDYKFLMENKSGIIVLSACLAGLIQQSIMNKDLEYAEGLIQRFKEEFGEDFYLEIQPNRLEPQKIVNKKLIELAKTYEIKFVATNDNHYILKDDKKVHDTLLLLKQKYTWEDVERLHKEKGTDDDEERDKVLLFSVDDLYLKNTQEMIDSFKNHEHDITDENINASIETTNEIAEKCNAKLDFSKPCFPATKIPEKYVSQIEEMMQTSNFEDTSEKRKLAYFKVLLNAGWQERIEGKIPEDKIQMYLDRLKFEFEVITTRGYTEYFLVVSEFIRWAKDQGILVGPGRGSACGSVISYLMKIIDIDPIPFALYFERFLNPERCLHPSMNVLTDAGSKNIFNDIKIGDKVKTLNGRYQKVKNKVISKVHENLLKINYDGGYKICTKNHKIEVFRDRKKIEIFAYQLLKTDKLIGLR